MASYLTFCERETLYRLLKAKKSMSEIGELMGPVASAIPLTIPSDAVAATRFTPDARDRAAGAGRCGRIGRRQWSDRK